MEVKVGECYGGYKLKVIMYEPQDNWEVKFLCENIKTQEIRIFDRVEMETIVKESMAFK